MRTITPELTALLRSRFQVAGDGYAGRIEIDSVTAPAEAEEIDLVALHLGGMDAVFDGNDHSYESVFGPGSDIFYFTVPLTLGTVQIFWHYGGAYTPSGGVGGVSGAAAPFTLEGGPSTSGPWTMAVEEPAYPQAVFGASFPEDFDLTYVLDEPLTFRYWRWTSTSGDNNDIYKILGFTPDTDGGVVTTPYRPKRIGLNRNLRMGPDQASIDLVNEGIPFGWGPTSILPTNSRIRCYQWYGDVANEVLTFTGVIDKIDDSRDPLTTSLECRSLAGPILVDQTTSTTAPQGADEDGHVRTEANGVYLSKEVDYIVADILERAGWPSDDIDVADTSFVLDEYLVTDGSSYWDNLAALAGFVGYTLWDDEDGVIHFRPLGDPASADDTLTPDYEYEIGIA